MTTIKRLLVVPVAILVSACQTPAQAPPPAGPSATVVALSAAAQRIERRLVEVMPEAPLSRSTLQPVPVVAAVPMVERRQAPPPVAAAPPAIVPPPVAAPVALQVAPAPIALPPDVPVVVLTRRRPLPAPAPEMPVIPAPTIPVLIPPPNPAPVPLPVPLPAPVEVPAPVDPLSESITTSWIGDLEPIVRKIAEIAGLGFSVIGVPPAVPVIVTLHADNQPVLLALRTLGAQVGAQGAQIAVLGNGKIELRYVR